jgi:hypothetical protein
VLPVVLLIFFFCEDLKSFDCCVNYRASEANMASIATSVEDLYMSHSRAIMNECLFALITEAVVAKVMTPERLVAEMAMLVSVLHGNVGSEVGEIKIFSNVFWLIHLLILGEGSGMMRGFTDVITNFGDLKFHLDR